MKKLIIIAATAAVLIIPATASAAADGYGNKGSEQALSAMAQCGTGASSGAFGAFGNFGGWHDLGINNDENANGAEPGTAGYLVGLNNSGVCGNR